MNPYPSVLSWCIFKPIHIDEEIQDVRGRHWLETYFYVSCFKMSTGKKTAENSCIWQCSIGYLASCTQSNPLRASWNRNNHRYFGEHLRITAYLTFLKIFLKLFQGELPCPLGLGHERIEREVNFPNSPKKEAGSIWNCSDFKVFLLCPESFLPRG